MFTYSNPEFLLNHNNFFPKILDKNKECPITYEIIKKRTKYLSCRQCNYNFTLNGIYPYLRLNQTCPMCRANWNHNYGFINYTPLMKYWLNFYNAIKNIINLSIDPDLLYPFNLSLLKDIKKRHNKRWFFGK
jgi:hypothetical protein